MKIKNQIEPTFFKLLLSFVLMTIPLASSVCQEQNVEFVKSNFQDQVREFKKAKQNIRVGFYHYEEDRFPIALKYLEDAQTFNPNNADLNYRLGVCYLQTYHKQKSLKHFKKAHSLDKNISTDIHYLIGKGYHLNYKFDKAIEAYNEHFESLSPEEKKIWKPQIDKRIKECKQGIDLMEKPLDVVITNIGNQINSEFPDYRPFITANDSMMIFTSRRPTTTGRQQDPKDFKFYEDIYVSTYKKGKWSTPTGIVNLNNLNHDAVAGISPDASKLIYFDGSKNGGDLYISEKNSFRWGVPKPLSDNINSSYAETSASFSLTGDTLYFVSDNPDISSGGKDIFFSIYDKEQEEYGPPKNLGSNFNTPYNEEGIVIHPDGKTIYFSSEGHSSMGGYDIFVCKKNSNGEWEKPVNMGYPINTPDDDVFFVVSGDGKHGYQASAREDALGDQDIYKIDFEKTEDFKYETIVAEIKKVEQKLDTANVISGEFIAEVKAKDDIETVNNEVVEDVIDTALVVEALKEDNLTEAERLYRVNRRMNINLDINDVNAKNEDAILREVEVDQALRPIDITIEIIDVASDKEVTTYYPSTKNEPVFEFLVPPMAEYEIDVDVEHVKTQYGKARLVGVNTKEELLFAESEIQDMGIRNYSEMLLSENKLDGDERSKMLEYYLEELEERKQNTTTTNDVAGNLEIISVEVEDMPESSRDIESKVVENISESNTTKSAAYFASDLNPVESRTQKNEEIIYTVQIRAQKHPISTAYFRDISGVNETYCKDGLYRYTVKEVKGWTQAYAERNKVRKSGYSDAFVLSFDELNNKRDKPITEVAANAPVKYTLQVLANNYLLDSSYFTKKGLSNVDTYSGRNGIVIYATGKYQTLEEAKIALEKLYKSGYYKAFIMKISDIKIQVGQ